MTSPDYQLKPARGKKTHTAFVVIADVLKAGSDDTPLFMVESLAKIQDSEAEAAPDHVRRRDQFTSLVAKMHGKTNRHD